MMQWVLEIATKQQTFPLPDMGWQKINISLDNHKLAVKVKRERIPHGYTEKP